MDLPMLHSHEKVGLGGLLLTADPDSSRANRNACIRKGLTSPDPLAHSSHSVAATCSHCTCCALDYNHSGVLVSKVNSI